MTIPPLNGTKTHPLSEHALGVLAQIAEAESGLARYRINPGVVNRLLREDLIIIRTRLSQNREYAMITEAGRDILREKGLLS